MILKLLPIMGLLRQTADQLAVFLLWYLFCRRFRAMDVYHQELPS